MLKIAICDDDAGDLERACALVRAYLTARPDLAARVSTFPAASALTDAVEQGDVYDLYILDIVMPGQNGIEAGKRLRKLSGEGEIVYLSTSADYAVDSYQARAFFYLLKPVDREAFFDVIDRAVSALQRRRSEGFTVNTRTGLRLLLLDRLLYVELTDRVMRCHLADGETVDSRLLREPFKNAVERLLQDRRFVLCGASLVLNLHHVQEVSRGEALLSNGERVPLTRTARSKVKFAWMDYWLNGTPEGR